AVHEVELLRAEVPVVRVIKRVRQVLRERLGPRSEWAHALGDVLGGDIPARPYTFFDVCVAVAECMVGNDVVAMLVGALNGGNRDRLRGILESRPGGKRGGQGTAEAVASRLAPEERLTLLVVLGNAVLGQVIYRWTSG